MELDKYSNKITIDFPIEVQFFKEENDIYSCYIPDFDIYYSAYTTEIQSKAKALVKMFAKFHSTFIYPPTEEYNNNGVHRELSQEILDKIREHNKKKK